MYSDREISLEDFERQMLDAGWQKKVLRKDSSWKYFYRTYIKTRKMIYSPRFHCSAPETFWVKLLPTNTKQPKGF